MFLSFRGIVRSASLPLLLMLYGSSLSCNGSVEPTADSKETTAAGAEVESLLGEPLYARKDLEGIVAQADRLVAEQPNDLAVLLVAAGTRVELWRYHEAIDLYTKAVEMAPEDWRPYRYRGHRYISIRQFDKAIRDLERARELAPHSFDVAYHLGLALFLEGRFEEAANEYERCRALANSPDALALDLSQEFGEDFRTCMEIRRSPSTRVAITEWMYRALRRAGRHDEARKLLDTIAADWTFEENQPYYLLLLFYKELRSEEDLLAPEMLWTNRFETLAYGVANWHIVEGNTARARELLEEIVRDPYWPGFGRIAAEADLVRMGSGS